MPKTRTTVTLDEEVYRAVRIRAARAGKRDSQVIEESLRRDLGLDALQDVWARVKPVAEDKARELADSEVHARRREGREAGGS